MEFMLAKQTFDEKYPCPRSDSTFFVSGFIRIGLILPGSFLRKSRAGFFHTVSIGLIHNHEETNIKKTIIPSG